MTPPTCSRCKKLCGGAKVIIKGLWFCGDCVYLMEMGREPRDKAKPKGRVAR